MRKWDWIFLVIGILCLGNYFISGEKWGIVWGIICLLVLGIRLFFDHGRME
jgi:hypothetical protein